MPKPRIAVTMGDPAGIGPEICRDLLTDSSIADLCTPIVFGDANVLRLCAQKTDKPADFKEISSNDLASATTPCVLDLELIGLFRLFALFRLPFHRARAHLVFADLVLYRHSGPHYAFLSIAQEITTRAALGAPDVCSGVSNRPSVPARKLLNKKKSRSPDALLGSSGSRWRM